MKYIKFISVSIIVLTIEIVILKVINDAVVHIKLHIIIQFVAFALYVIAFIVLNKVIVNMMIVEWFIKPKQSTRKFIEWANQPKSMINNDIVIRNLNSIEQADKLIDDMINELNNIPVKKVKDINHDDMYKDDTYEDLLG